MANAGHQEPAHWLAAQLILKQGAPTHFVHEKVNGISLEDDHLHTRASYAASMPGVHQKDDKEHARLRPLGRAGEPGVTRYSRKWKLSD